MYRVPRKDVCLVLSFLFSTLGLGISAKTLGIFGIYEVLFFIAGLIGVLGVGVANEKLKRRGLSR